jgi:hypothetical protein
VSVGVIIKHPLAEQGIAPAQNNLGSMFDNGLGVPQNDKNALKWYRLTAEQGLPSPHPYSGI